MQWTNESQYASTRRNVVAKTNFSNQIRCIWRKIEYILSDLYEPRLTHRYLYYQ